MKHLLFLSLLVYAACSPAKKSDAVADTAKKDSVATAPAEVKVDSATQVANYQAYVTPSSAHQMLAKTCGTWNADVTMWMDGHEMKSKGKSVAKMVFNGLYQETTFTATMMGAPFTGKSITGYDNHLKKLVSVWYDSMGSGIMFMTGEYNETTKSTTSTGSMVDPGTKQVKTVKEVTTNPDDNTQIFDMYEVSADGKETKTMSITYTRAK